MSFRSRNSHNTTTTTTTDNTSSIVFNLTEDQLKEMPLMELHRELEKVGISTKTMFERYELMDAYKRAREETKVEEPLFEDGWTISFDPNFIREL